MKTVYGYDRLGIWFDVPDLPFAIRTLRPHCSNVKVTLGQMRFQSMWQIKIELHQPSRKCLEVLANELCNGTSTLINYVEIAQDVLITGSHSSRDLRTSFLSAARMRYQRQEVWQSAEGGEDGTHYFGRRNDANTLAIYSDKPSKLNVTVAETNKDQCLHIEWRARNTAALQSIGLVSIEDLINFDHEAFWDSHLNLYRMPRRTELGRIMARAKGSRDDVGAAALRTRARKWKASYCDDYGNFILHNALLGKPDLVRQLERTTIEEWKKSAEAKFSGAPHLARR